MKKYVLLSVAGVILLLLAGSAWAQCPEDGNDPGVCDTVYVECYDPFNYTPPPWQVRFPILITNDIPNPATDSVAGMLIPLTFTSSNPAADARIDAYYNGTAVHPSPDLERSVFRHLPSMDDPQIRNWMMDLAEQGSGLEWNTKILDLSYQPDVFWLALVPTGYEDQLFPGGSRVLVATMTFSLADTTTLCLDTCFWPPTDRLAFSRSDAVTYIPRDNMPYCASVRYEGGPGQDPADNGDCDSFYVEAYPADRYQLSFPAQVRVPMYVTNDIPDPHIDSIAGMIIPLGLESSNPAANARSEWAYNNTSVYPFPDLENSIFRHLPSMQNPQERNWMMDLSEQGTGLVWDTRILDISAGYNIWISLVPSGTPNQRFPGGSQLLTATVTITLDDSTTICIDILPWPPDPWYSIRFSRSDAVTYSPQQNIPYCTSIELSEHGDANGDGVINFADVMYMINYLYKSGPYPVSFEAGDANCDGDHGIVDIILLINYLYKGGRPPGCI